MDEHLSQRPNGHNGRHPFPEIQAFIEWLKNCGVNNSTQVVAYDDAGGVYASRLWCLLKWLGHEAVAVLNGGVQSWIESKGILEREVTQVPEKGNFQPHTKDILVDSQYILKNLKNNGVLVIDARANDRFRGENETIDPIAGHIPGAKNRFFKTNLDDDGKFKSANTLKRSFLELIDVGTDQQVVHQCGSGVTACHNMLAMEVAGIKNSKLYPGSWSEWIADTTRPISTG
jgi:thiosulfate/3-mercaptopyruvate sulfurtransferase